MLLVGCAALQRVAGDIVLPAEDEIALGRELSRQFEEHYRLVPDEVVQSYVQDIGELLVVASGKPRPEVEWSFRVVDEPEEVNALALPGGWIYVYSGLLLMLDSEAELAGVLAHEIAHVNERHVAERLATIYGVEVLRTVALGRDPGTLATIVGSMVAQGYLLSYSRSQEREADALAVEYTIEAGWDPRSLATFFEALDELPRPPMWLSTHPSPLARKEFIHERVAGRVIPTTLGRERYQKVRERLRAPAEVRLGMIPKSLPSGCEEAIGGFKR